MCPCAWRMLLLRASREFVTVTMSQVARKAQLRRQPMCPCAWRMLLLRASREFVTVSMSQVARKALLWIYPTRTWPLRHEEGRAGSAAGMMGVFQR